MGQVGAVQGTPKRYAVRRKRLVFLSVSCTVQIACRMTNQRAAQPFWEARYE